MTGGRGEGVGPKLYTYKPKKAQLKKHRQQHPSSSPSPATTSSMASSSSSSSSSSTPPPPQVPKESFIRRYKYVWPLLLTVNLAIGGYFFMRTTKKKETSVEGEVPTAAATATATVAPVVDKPSPSAIVEPVKLREPIPEDQQRELFKWILEEKRKVKTKDPLEKKHIDEEKAIIKQFLRAKSIPPL